MRRIIAAFAVSLVAASVSHASPFLSADLQISNGPGSGTTLHADSSFLIAASLGTPGADLAAAQALPNYGALRVLAEVDTSGAPVVANTDAFFEDELRILTQPGGAMAILETTWTVDVTGVSTVGSNVIQRTAQLFINGQAFNIVGPGTFTQRMLVDASALTIIQGQLVVSISAPAGRTGHVRIDLMNTATLTGLQLFEMDGITPIAATFSSASGTAYPVSVPEPALALLLAAGALGGRAALRRRA